MNQIKHYLNSDHFKIGRFGDKHVKNINLGVLIVGSILIFALIFYTIIYSVSNFGALTTLKEYVQTYDAEENAQFENVNLAMKIMPSYNTAKNVIYMTHSQDIYKSKIPNSISLMESFNMSNTFFFFNKTSMFFPKLMYTKENIPVGDSINMCITVSWSPKERGNNYDIMKPVLGFPRCKTTESGKFIWNSEDPVYGIDIPVWKQHTYEVDCADEEDCDKYCDSNYNAEFVNGKTKKRCYSYDVLDTICIVIEYDPITEDFSYAGGCFKGNMTHLMTPAEQNRVYHFEGIEIEVRNKKDPIIKAGEMSEHTYNFAEKWDYFAIFLNILLFFAFIGAIVIVYFIFYYKKKFSAGGLLSGEKKPVPDTTNEIVN